MIEAAAPVEKLREDPQVFWNLSQEELAIHAESAGQGERILVINEGEVEDGAFSTDTLKSSRSPKDKFYVVSEKTSSEIYEGVNAPLEKDKFKVLRQEMLGHLSRRDRYVQDVALGVKHQDVPDTRITVRVITERPTHAMFAQILYKKLTRDEKAASEKPGYKPDLTVFHSPSFKCDPDRHGTRTSVGVVVDYDNGEAILADTDYHGEVKKLGYTYLHKIAESANEKVDENDAVTIMHGSIYQKIDGNAVVVKGGSGAGKSSALPFPTPEQAALGEAKIGDDEVIVRFVNGKTTVENPEGGLYGTTANYDKEPEFKKASMRKRSLLENVKKNRFGQPNFSDETKNPNARAAIPLSEMPEYKDLGVADGLSDVVLLNPDTTGMSDPIVRFDNIFQTMLYDLIGPGSVVPGRAEDEDEIELKFSPLNDEPFLYKSPESAIDALRKIYSANGTQGWLVNSGWRDGPVGVGERPPVEYTQLAVRAVIDGSLESANWERDPVFGFWTLPEQEGVDPRLTKAGNIWKDERAKQESRIEYAKKIRQFFYEHYLPETTPFWEILERQLPQIPDREPITKGRVIFSSAA